MFSLQKRMPRGFIIVIFKYFKNGHVEADAGLVTAVQEDRTRSNGLK